MSEPRFNSLFDTLQRWFSLRSHRQRIGILLLGWILIYTLWYGILQKPLLSQRAYLVQQTQALKTQIAIFQAESEKIMRESAERVNQQRLSTKNAITTKLQWTSSSDSDEIVKEILSAEHHVELTSLKTNEGTGTKTASGQTLRDSLEIVFNSGYFDTLFYLQQLEKLPWCLSWDSMEYKVINYPMATVTINLSIVSNN